MVLPQQVAGARNLQTETTEMATAAVIVATGAETTSGSKTMKGTRGTAKTKNETRTEARDTIVGPTILNMILVALNVITVTGRRTETEIADMAVIATETATTTTGTGHGGITVRETAIVVGMARRGTIGTEMIAMSAGTLSEEVREACHPIEIGRILVILLLTKAARKENGREV